MTPAEFKRRYQQAIPAELREFDSDDSDEPNCDDLTTLPAKRGKNLLLTSTERELLTGVGLPSNGPAMLFSMLNNPEPLEEFPTCIQIGQTHYGDPVCLDTETRQVVYFNHDLDMERVLVNSSLMKMAECLAVFMEYAFLKLPPEELDEKRMNALIQVDPALAEQDSIWRKA